MRNNILILCVILSNVFFIQSCCNKGDLYHYLDKEDYFAYKVGDTILYTNDIDDTAKYIISSLYRKVVKTGEQPEECYNYEYSELEIVGYQNLYSKNDSNWFSIKPPNEFYLNWDNTDYQYNCCNDKIDSLIIKRFTFYNVRVFNNQPGLTFNFKYGIIQYKDTLGKTWTLN